MAKNRYVDFREEIREKVNDAFDSILEGKCSRVDISKNVKVYECKNVIRADFKISESSEEE